jgi:SAM-dependent methyltransferase
VNGEATGAFDGAVDAYDAIRPQYPTVLFDDLFALLPSQPRIIEVGPGTGQATRDLLAHHAAVRAVEIGPAMAARLRSNLPAETLQVCVGPFESVPLDRGWADCVFSATAYHWVTRRAQTDRPAALLVPRGTVAIVDTIQVESSDDHGFFEACQPIHERFGGGHSGPPAPTRNREDPPIRSLLVDDARYRDVAVRHYDWNQTYSAAEYRTLLLSYSGTQALTDQVRVELLDAMEAFVNDRFGGQITRPLVVTLTTARLR